MHSEYLAQTLFYTVKQQRDPPCCSPAGAANPFPRISLRHNLGCYIEKPKAFIAKIELLKLPLLRTWMIHLKCVFMDRSDIRQSLKVINQAADHLKEGYSMIIFPEGTRSKNETFGEFKPGSLKLALKAGVPIVPVLRLGFVSNFVDFW